MAAYTNIITLTDGGSHTMVHDGYIVVGANGGTATVSMNMSETSTDDYYEFTDTIETGKCKGIQVKLPAGTKVKVTGTASKLLVHY